VPYVNNYIKEYAVVPGLITVKDFKSSSYDYGIAFGKLSYTPIQNTKDYSLNIQFGSDKISMVMVIVHFCFPIVRLHILISS